MENNDDRLELIKDRMNEFQELDGDKCWLVKEVERLKHFEDLVFKAVLMHMQVLPPSWLKEAVELFR